MLASLTKVRKALYLLQRVQLGNRQKGEIPRKWRGGGVLTAFLSSQHLDVSPALKLAKPLPLGLFMEAPLCKHDW